MKKKIVQSENAGGILNRWRTCDRYTCSSRTVLVKYHHFRISQMAFHREYTSTTTILEVYFYHSLSIGFSLCSSYHLFSVLTLTKYLDILLTAYL